MTAPVLHWPKLFEGQSGWQKTSSGRDGYGYGYGYGYGDGYGYGYGDGYG